MIQIDDDFVQWIRRSDFTVDSADDFLVCAGHGKFMPARERCSSFNDEAYNHVVFGVVTCKERSRPFLTSLLDVPMAETEPFFAVEAKSRFSG